MSEPLNRQELQKYTSLLWKIFIGMIAFSATFIFCIGLGLFGKMPTFRDLENPKSNLASEIISEDNVVLGTYYLQNRSNVRYEQISPNVINALVATEDIRFYTHSGIDFRRIFTIIFYNFVGNKQGASTITQQLALNLFSERAKNPFKRIIQKLQEWIIAVKLERNYTKEEILTLYLNTVDFGAYNTFGIKSAARTYFNTTPNKLSPDQAAVLIGMLKGPSFYSPTHNPERALARRNTVLDNMRKAGYLGDEETIKYQQIPLNLNFNPSDYNEGLAPYFRAMLKKEVQRIFEEQSITKADGTPYDLDRDGLKLYTTINASMQKYAEEAQREYMKELQKQFNAQWKGRQDPFKGYQQLLDQGIKRSDRYRQLQAFGKTEAEIQQDFNTPAKMTIFSWKGNIDTLMRPIDSLKYYKLLLRNALMSMEPQNGHVKAWVGGTNFEYFKYDQVKMGTRQVGSTAKPFTYAIAIDNGYSPCLTVPNVPVEIEGWRPSGSSSIKGSITLKKALAYSQNYVTAYMMKQVGATAVSTLIKKMGVTSDVPANPTICLGSFDASVYDMVGAYSAFVNHGIWTEPTYLLRIEDKNGNTLYEHKPKVVYALNEQTAYVMTQMLKGVVEYGTGSRLRTKYGLTNPIGGKTGTTQNNSDGWFMGITPQLVTGVWTGCEDRAIHFFSTKQGEGANSALPIFALFMKKVYADGKLNYTKGDFEPPKEEQTIAFDCNTYATPKKEVAEEVLEEVLEEN
jgi:penicillin-binding protein 1A